MALVALSVLSRLAHRIDVQGTVEADRDQIELDAHALLSFPSGADLLVNFLTFIVFPAGFCTDGVGRIGQLNLLL